jgi:pyochelin synthetase
MNVRELIDDLETSGIRLWVEADQLRFRAPQGVMTADRREALRARKAEVVAHLRGAAALRADPDPASRHEPFPLTDIQAAYLVGRGDTYDYGGTACHAYVELAYPHADGEIDPDRLAAAWRGLVAAHDMLRAVVHPDGYQQVLAPDVTGHPQVPVTDLRPAPPAQVQVALEGIRAQLDHRVGDPQRWPLCLLRLTRCPDRTVAHLSVDLLVVDFTSLALLLDELHLRYADPLAAPPAPELTFRDYVLAARRLAATGQAERDRAYWWSRLDGLPAAPELPALERTATGPARFRRLATTVTPARWERLRQRAARHGVTPSAVLLTAYAEVIGCWSRHPRFTLNVPTFTRHPVHPDVDRLVGDFTAVELLEVDLSAPAPFADRVRDLAARLLEDLAHPLCTGSEVLAELARRRGRSAALMPVVFTSALDAAPPARHAPGVPRPRVAHALTQTPQVWIDCQVLERDGGLAVSWDCREGVFPDGLLDDAFGVFAGLLDRLLGPDGDGEVWESADLVGLPPAQARRRAEIDDTAAPVPGGLLHEPVLARAATDPDAVAVVDASGQTTYAELAGRARAVAVELRARGVEPGELVAVVMDKGVEQVVAVLGILLAGAAYLPVDTTQPAARRDAILTDARVRQALTQSWLRAGLGDLPGGVATLDVDTLPPVAAAAAAAPPSTASPGDLAYVITTSGSTGAPKGVMISHEAALNTVVDVTARFGVTADDRVLGLAALGFDLSVYDVFGALAAGATLVLPEPARRGDPSHWAELVARHGVTVWNSVPGQLQMLHDHLPPGAAGGLASLRLALLSGDWIPVTLPDQIRALVPGLQVVSLGGATEGAIWSIAYPVGEVDPSWPSIPYGWPLTNQTLRVLDHRLRPRPDWVVGELYIGGTGVALGYRGDPERTAERFLTHPATGERLYRTGDLGRHLGGDRDGVIEFLGREDTQVKIRGYRIELAEVEAALHGAPGVATGAVLVDSDTFSGHRLAAFVQPARTDPPPPGSTAVAEAARAALDPLPAEPTRHLAGFVAAMDEAGLLAMAATLRGAGLFGDPAAAHTADEVCAALGALPRHRRLVRRWLRALVRAGRLAGSDDGRYRGLAVAGPDRLARAWRDLAAAERQVGWSADLLDHLRACADRLPGLLDGSVAVAGLLFPGAPADAVRAAYRDNLAVRGLNRAAAAAVAELARSPQRPPGPLRVLEVGGGVGGATAELVPALAGLDVEYLFTDPSAFFVAEARERFADHAWVRHARFDPEQDPRPQGLLPNSVDAVVAGNALHRCADLPAVLGRLGELLSPGGLLVLVEQTRDDSPALMVSMEFLEALAEEPADARRDTDIAFVDAAGWARLLTAAGGEPELVLPGEDDPLAVLGQRLLVARCKADRARLEIGELVRHVAERLPEYMVPAHWQVLDALPLSANGKVDRAALRRLLPSESDAGVPATAGSSAPRDDRERELAALWAELLGCERVGRDDDFFALGGDSLLVARLVGRLRERVPALVELEWDMVLRHLLHQPTVAALAEYLRGLDEAPAGTAPAPAGPASPVVALNGSGGTATVLVHAGVGTIMPYRALITEIRRRAAGATRLVGLEVPDLDGFLDADPAGLIDRLAADYAGALLDTGADRFHVVGYCLGGLISTEVTRTLTEAGAEVATFTAVSSHAPPFRLDDELLSEYSFAVMMGIDPVQLGFPADAERFVAAAQEVLGRTPGVMPDGGFAALTGEYADIGDHFRRLAQVPRTLRVARMCEAVPPSVGSFTPAQLLRMFRTFRQSVFAITRYRPEPYAGDIAFLRHGGPYPFPGSRDSVTRYWEELCLGDLTVTDIVGDHFTCLADDHVPAVLRHLVAITDGEILA